MFKMQSGTSLGNAPRTKAFRIEFRIWKKQGPGWQLLALGILAPDTD